jgi:DNA repair exonuclease SbcCD ATPase subunit
VDQEPPANWLGRPLRFIDGKDVGRTAAWLQTRRGHPIPVRVAEIGAVVIENQQGELCRTFDTVERVVSIKLGFDNKTFVYSVLLQQGRSEALLSAKAPERHRMLTQIIDLSGYERLHQRANNYQKDLEREVKALTSQLSNLAPVDSTALATLQQEIETAQNQKAITLATQVQLSAWKAQSERWQKLVGEQESVEQQLVQGQKLFERAVLIEQNAARHHTLASVLPLLRYIFAKCSERTRIVQHIEADQQQAVTCQTQLELLTAQKSQRQQIIQSLEQHKDELQVQQNIMSKQIEDLLPALQEIIVLEKKQRQCDGIQQQLAAIPKDLEMQCLQTQDELQKIMLIKQAQPLLQQFSKARQHWQQAESQQATLLQLYRCYLAFLQSWLCGEPYVPLRFPAGKFLDSFPQLRAAMQQLRAAAKAQRGYGYHIETRQQQTRSLGVQTIANMSQSLIRPQTCP